MSGMPEVPASMKQPVSELMDGEANAALTEAVCLAWRQDPSLRETWRTWHVIGDVLRSDDLAPRQQGEASFLAVLRQRLDAEPAIVAPLPEVRRDDVQRASLRRRRAWTGGVAIAAGFFAVAGALVVLQTPSVNTEATTLVKSDPTASNPPTAMATSAVTVAASPASAPQVLVVNGKLIRDARLDHYLAAHKSYSAFGMPAGFTRNAPADAPNR